MQPVVVRPILAPGTVYNRLSMLYRLEWRQTLTPGINIELMAESNLDMEHITSSYRLFVISFPSQAHFLVRSHKPRGSRQRSNHLHIFSSHTQLHYLPLLIQ